MRNFKFYRYDCISACNAGFWRGLSNADGSGGLYGVFSGEARNKAMAVFGLVVIVAPILGPVMGGYITENWSWPYIFL